MNPIFQRTQQMNGGQGGNPFMNFMNNFNNFRDFARGMNPNDAKAKVEEMLANGQMTKEQFEQFSQMANQFQSMIGNRK